MFFWLLQSVMGEDCIHLFKREMTKVFPVVLTVRVFIFLCVYVCSVWGGVSTLAFWGGSLPRGPPPPPPQASPPSSPGPSEGTAAPASNPTMKRSHAGNLATADWLMSQSYFVLFYLSVHFSYPQRLSFTFSQVGNLANAVPFFFICCWPYFFSFPQKELYDKSLLCLKQTHSTPCFKI